MYPALQPLGGEKCGSARTDSEASSPGGAYNPNAAVMKTAISSRLSAEAGQ